MLFLSSFVDYSWEPKEAPKDPEQNLHENRLRYAIELKERKYYYIYKDHSREQREFLT